MEKSFTEILVVRLDKLDDFCFSLQNGVKATFMVSFYLVSQNGFESRFEHSL